MIEIEKIQQNIESAIHFIKLEDKNNMQTKRQIYIFKQNILKFMECLITNSPIQKKSEYKILYDGIDICINTLQDYTFGLKINEFLLQKKPHYYNLYYQKGLIHYKLQQYDICIQICNNLSEQIKESYPNFFILVGQSLQQQQKYEEAIEQYTKFKTLQPNNVLGYQNLASAYYKQKDVQKSIEILEYYLNKINKNSEKMFGDLAKIYEEQKQYDKSIEIYKQMVDFNPSNHRGYLNWGYILSIQDKHLEASQKYEKACEINPNSERAFNNWGMSLTKLGKHEDAQKKFQKSVEINPKYEMAYFQWGYLLSSLQQKQSAIEKYQKVIELDPKDEKTYYNMGSCYSYLKNTDSAIQSFKKAILASKKFIYDKAYESLKQLLSKNEFQTQLAQVNEFQEKMENFPRVVMHTNKRVKTQFIVFKQSRLKLKFRAEIKNEILEYLIQCTTDLKQIQTEENQMQDDL